MNDRRVAKIIRKCQEEQSDFLDLRNLGLKEIPAEVFEMTHLRRLNLGRRYYKKREWIDKNYKRSFNNIKQLPKELALLQNLEELSLEGNSIADIEILSKLPHLQQLNIGGIKLKSFEILHRLPNLKALNVNNLDLRSIDWLSNFNFFELTELDMSSNGIQKIENLESLANLERLSLNSNQIKEIKNLELLTKLKKLSLGSNQITEIKNLESLTELKKLSLDSNQ
ncbi:MAG TPA: leucine-rich repeat protein, partial [Flavilitoribacter sp.]|nr:leucine-rich repeat protein [Flavilitoribacter sp.]